MGNKNIKYIPSIDNIKEHLERGNVKKISSKDLIYIYKNITIISDKRIIHFPDNKSVEIENIVYKYIDEELKIRKLLHHREKTLNHSNKNYENDFIFIPSDLTTIGFFIL